MLQPGCEGCESKICQCAIVDYIELEFLRINKRTSKKLKGSLKQYSTLSTSRA
jgi:hypothetical protein